MWSANEVIILPWLYAMKELLVYFNSHMRIAARIMDIIPGWFRVFQQDCGAYKHKIVYFVFVCLFVCYFIFLCVFLFFYFFYIFIISQNKYWR